MEPIYQYLNLFIFVCIRMQALKGNDCQVICFHPLPPAELVYDRESVYACESSFVDSKNEDVITISLLITLETNLTRETEWSLTPSVVSALIPLLIFPSALAKWCKNFLRRCDRFPLSTKDL